MEGIDYSALIDNSGVGVIALLLIKIIWNDLRHVDYKLEKLVETALKSEKHLAKLVRHAKK